jgi:hypothetical protein
MKTRNSLKFLNRKINAPISISLIDEIILSDSSEEEILCTKKYLNIRETEDSKNNSDCYAYNSRMGGSTTTETKRGRKKKIISQTSQMTINLCSSEEKDINEIRLNDEEILSARSIYSLSDDLDENSCSDSSYKSRVFNSSHISEDSISSVSDVSSVCSKHLSENSISYRRRQTIPHNRMPPKDFDSQTVSQDDETYSAKDESIPGDIRLDKIRRIISGTITDPVNKKLSLVVEFQERTDGVKPSNKKYHDSVLRKYAPNVLIDFLKSRICTNKTYIQYTK